MTETTEQPTDQPESGQPQALPIGRTLAAAREQQGLSVADVARNLRLSIKQIEALEADDFASLPGNTFVRGFIRNYARLGQIDAEPLLQALQQRVPSEAHAVSTPPRGGEFSPSAAKRWLWYAGAAALMVVGAPLLVYVFLSGGAAPTAPAKPATPLPPPQAAQQFQPLPLPAAAPAAQSVASGRLVLQFEEQSWAEVTDKDGRKLLSQVSAAGSEQALEGQPPLAVVVGNAAHVKITYNGRPVDLAPHISANVAHLTLQ